MKHKIVLILDSMAALLSLSKGRSSAPGLLRPTRAFASQLLRRDAEAIFRWVPSAHNPADAPSRKGGSKFAPPRGLLHSSKAGTTDAFQHDAALQSNVRALDLTFSQSGDGEGGIDPHSLTFGALGLGASVCLKKQATTTSIAPACLPLNTQPLRPP